MLAQGGEQKAFRTQKQLAAAGSKHTRPRTSLGQQVWALKVTKLKGALATPHRDFARPGRPEGAHRGPADGAVRRGRDAEEI